MADLLHSHSQGYRAWHPDALTRLDFLALRTQLINTLEREERVTRRFAASLRTGGCDG